jgi:hypothetical protein
MCWKKRETPVSETLREIVAESRGEKATSLPIIEFTVGISSKLKTRHWNE